MKTFHTIAFRIVLLILFAGPLLLLYVPSSPYAGPGIAEAQSNRYDIENSLQFNSASSRYLSKNFWAVGSTTKWTFSVWVKRDSTGSYNTILAAVVGSTQFTSAFCTSGCNGSGGTANRLNVQYYPGSYQKILLTNNTFTSTSDWYHIVIAADTSQATESDRLRVYVNGTEQTYVYNYGTVVQNSELVVTDNNNGSGTNVTHYIGSIAGSNSFDGLMTDVILVDGQQLTPSAFGYDDGGVWRPKDFAATSTTANNPYGTNGFRLDFADRSNLGKDRSGRGNNFTLNNIGSAQQSTTTPALFSRTSATSTQPSGELFITGDVFFATSTSVAYSLSKGAGSFVIDHVLDPLNKLLYHSFVESPDMKNIYTGVTELDAGGSATIELPSYFLALNRNFRYLGSPMGGAMPNLHVSKEVRRKWFFWGIPVFKISGGAPNGKISWQITGIRQDPYAKKNPIRTEVEKGPDEMVDKGEYLHPELYNAQ